MRAYSDVYVRGAQLRLGAMLDFAVTGCELELTDYYRRFLDSGLALRFGQGEPGLIAGCSGSELVLKVLGSDNETLVDRARTFTPVGGATPEYWTGWALAYYQWESGRSFSDIQQLIDIDCVRELYHPFHEMDITRFCDQMDTMCVKAQPNSALKTRRILAGLSQSQLAQAAGVPLRTLQQYEQRRKDINKAQVEYLIQLARVLHCRVEDLLEYSSQPHYEYAFVSLD